MCVKIQSDVIVVAEEKKKEWDWIKPQEPGSVIPSLAGAK